MAQAKQPKLRAFFAVPQMVALGLTALSVGAWDTSNDINGQRIAAAQAEIQSLQNLSTLLTDGKPLEGPGSFSFFISKAAIDSLLIVTEGENIVIPGGSDAVLTINHASSDFRIGFPAVDVDATIKKGNLSLKASLVARLQADIDPKDPSRLTLRIHIDSLIPVVTWGIFDFTIMGLVHDLAQAKLENTANGPGALGSLSIPIQQHFDLSLGAMSSLNSVKGAILRIDTPPLALHLTISVTHTVFLPDGIHVYGTVHV